MLLPARNFSRAYLFDTLAALHSPSPAHRLSCRCCYSAGDFSSNAVDVYFTGPSYFRAYFRFNRVSGTTRSGFYIYLPRTHATFSSGVVVVGNDFFSMSPTEYILYLNEDQANPNTGFDLSDNVFRNITVASTSKKHLFFQLNHLATGVSRRITNNKLQFIDCTTTGSTVDVTYPLLQIQVPDWVAIDLVLQLNSFYNPSCPRDVGLVYNSKVVGSRQLFVDLTRNHWRGDSGVLSASQILSRVLDGRIGDTRPMAIVEPYLLAVPDSCGADPPPSATTAAPTTNTTTAAPLAVKEMSFTYTATGSVQTLSLPTWAQEIQCSSVEAQLWGAAGGAGAARTDRESTDSRVGNSGAGGFTRIVFPVVAAVLYVSVGTGGKANASAGWPDGGSGHNGYRNSAGGGGGTRISWDLSDSVGGIVAIAAGGGGAGPYSPSHAGKGLLCGLPSRKGPASFQNPVICTVSDAHAA